MKKYTNTLPPCSTRHNIQKTICGNALTPTKKHHILHAATLNHMKPQNSVPASEIKMVTVCFHHLDDVFLTIMYMMTIFITHANGSNLVVRLNSRTTVNTYNFVIHTKQRDNTLRHVLCLRNNHACFLFHITQ